MLKPPDFNPLACAACSYICRNSALGESLDEESHVVELLKHRGVVLPYRRGRRCRPGRIPLSISVVVSVHEEGRECRGKVFKRIIDALTADKIELSGRTIRFKKPGVGITLDGIAKGYIVDKASKVLTDLQIKNHLINAGGDIRTSGANLDKKPWTVAIQDPQKKRQYPDIIQMTDGAIATSGNYEVYFDREKMFHHIVNPKTGMSPDLSASVSVLADTAMNADALSTSVFVMKPAAGIRLIDSMPSCECLVVSRTGKLYKSPGWKS